MDKNFVIVFKRTGANPDKTPAHPLVESTSTADQPPGAKAFVIVYGHDSSEGARERYFHTGCARENVQAKEVVLCTGRAELKEAKLPNVVISLLAPFVSHPKGICYLQLRL